jgi:HSP20 family protein
MTVRDFLPFGKASVPVTQGANPIRTFQDEVNQLFGEFFGDLSFPHWGRSVESLALAVRPAIDMSENEKGYSLSLELPGMEVRDVQITVADGYVTVKGEKKQEKKEEKEGYFRQERSYGAFQRVIALPENAHLDKAEAQMKNGVLAITIPKKAGAQAKERTLEIRQVA